MNREVHVRFCERVGLRCPARLTYVRPAGLHGLSLVDDLKADALARMKAAGFAPATVIETSPGNLQAWLKHGETLDEVASTRAANLLAEPIHTEGIYRIQHCRLVDAVVVVACVRLMLRQLRTN